MIYCIINEQSGGGKGRKTGRSVRNTLLQAGIPFEAVRTQKKGDAFRFAKRVTALKETDKVLLVIGGDGTVGDALAGLGVGSGIPVIILQAGSGNDFTRGLSLPDYSPDTLLAMVRKPAYRPVDLGEFTLGEGKSGFFGISAGCGMDALVCKKVDQSKIKPMLNKIHLGKLSYLVITVISLFTMKTANVTLTVGGKEHVFPKFIFSAFMNMKAEGGGVKMTPKASFDDGKISVLTAAGLSRPEAFLRLPGLAAGKAEGVPGFTFLDGEEVGFHADIPVSFHADGEYYGDITDVTLRMHKCAINLIVLGEGSV